MKHNSRNYDQVNLEHRHYGHHTIVIDIRSLLLTHILLTFYTHIWNVRKFARFTLYDTAMTPLTINAIPIDLHLM